MLEQLVSCPKRSQAIYRPRRPEKTVLFKIIKRHYKTWSKNSEIPIPKYVKRTFEKYLECGNLAKGFGCAYCDCCNKEFFVAFSCKGRGICPSCNTLAMVKTAAHLIENMIPLVPIRQWVISFPLRIRHYLLEHNTLQDVLEIVVKEIRNKVIACSPNISKAQIGAVSFIQNFGSTLNVHPHFHLIVSDGIFCTEEGELQFHETFLTQADIRDTQECIRKRVLKWFGKKGWFHKGDIEKMLSYENSGFSLDASVRIHSWDRDGLERLIRYCARPCFASENLRWNGPWLIYNLSKPTYKGQKFIQLDPLEFLDRIAAFIPLPHRHRRHYHGAFAPNSPLRKKVVAYAQQRIGPTIAAHIQKVVTKARRVSLDWAQLIKRIYEVNPLTCAGCGREIKISGFVTHQVEINRILRGIGWPMNFHEFDPPYEIPNGDVCQLIGGTEDGFPLMEDQIHYNIGPDPPSQESYNDPPYWENNCDPPHCEENIDPPHWSD